MKNFLSLFFLMVMGFKSWCQRISFSPILAIERGFSKIKINANGLPATFKNNIRDSYFSYGLSLNYQINDDFELQLLIKKAEAAFSYGYFHKRNSTLYPTGSFVEEEVTKGSLSFTHISVSPGFALFNKKKKSSSFNATFFLNMGIGINIRTNEDPNAGKILLNGVNGNGQSYFTDDSIYQVKQLRISLPIQLQVNSFLKNKPFLKLAFLFNPGITSAYKLDARYTVNNNAEYITILQSNGTSLSIMISYPISFRIGKNKQLRHN